MNLWTEVRRAVLADGMSRRDAAEKFKLNFRTIQKILAHVEPPGYRRTELREKPNHCPIHSACSSLPPGQAGSAFASCLSGPSRRSLALWPIKLQTAQGRLLSPKLRTLCYLHIRWDSYPAGATFTGTGLSPAGTTNLFTAHPVQGHTVTAYPITVGDRRKNAFALPNQIGCRSARRLESLLAHRRIGMAERAGKINERILHGFTCIPLVKGTYRSIVPG